MKKFTIFNGPKEYIFIDPDTKRVYQNKTKLALINDITEYRSQNRLPTLDNLSAVIDNYLCTRPENQGGCTEYKLERHLVTYIKGGVTLLKNMLFKSYVKQVVADERSAICKDCPGNVFPDKGPFIAWSDSVAEQSVGDRKSVHHKELGTCLACTCTMKAKVWLGGKIDLTEEEKKKMLEYNPKCWQVATLNDKIKEAK